MEPSVSTVTVALREDTVQSSGVPGREVALAQVPRIQCDMSDALQKVEKVRDGSDCRVPGEAS